MKTPTNVVESFNTAVQLDENFDEVGNINWNFVEADIHIDASEFGFDIPEDFDVLFETLIAEFIARAA